VDQGFPRPVGRAIQIGLVRLRRLSFTTMGMIIRTVAHLLLIIVASAAAGCAASAPAVEGGPAPSFRQAVFAEGRLWLLTNDGELSSLAEGEDRPRSARLDSPVLSICSSSGRLRAVTGQSRGASTWTLRSHTGGGWQSDVQIDADDEELLGIACDGDRVTLLSTSRIREVHDRDVRSLRLSESLQGYPAITTMLAAGDAVYVGLNIGEWGGGLRRIERSTGRVAMIERADNADPCGTPLDSRCDPVNGLIASPRNPDCVMAAIGLVHFLPSGRIVEICGDAVELVFSREYRPDPANAEPYGEIAFFGVAPSGDGIVAAGIDGIYRLTSSGEFVRRETPTWRRYGSVRVSYEDPEVILVMTDINQRASVSGSTPILVPR
jgi:hypothetical protein